MNWNNAFLQCVAAVVYGLSVAFLWAGPVKAVQILYTAEGDTSNATDRLIDDGAQDGVFEGAGVTVSDTNPRFGDSAFRLVDSDGSRDVIVLPETTNLGDQFTLALHAKLETNTTQRLFSNYSGNGPLKVGELTMDLIAPTTPDGTFAFRIAVNTTGTTTEIKTTTYMSFKDGGYHHLAATYNNGDIRLYFDGVQVRSGTVSPGAVTLSSDLSVGAGKSSYLQLVGDIDDILVFTTALPKIAVWYLARKGAEAYFLGDSRPTLSGMTYPEEDALDIGSRRELFVDDALIARTTGELRLALHRPERKDIVFTADKSWEGNASSFQSIVVGHDGKYRLYYRGQQYPEFIGGPKDTPEHRWHAWVLCYAESTDGIHWTRPDLGICEFKGSTQNNIILDPSSPTMKAINSDPGGTAVFYDTNPACPLDERYKIVLSNWTRKPRALFILVSGDGIHFRLLSETPCLEEGPLDSQNTIFWDTVAKKYRAYYRRNRNGRNVATASSEDIRSFPPGDFIERDSGDLFELYTNQMQPYYRAPHIILGFPMRYYDRLLDAKDAWEWPTIRALPNFESRKARYGDGTGEKPRYAVALTDAILLAGRDGVNFKAWNEAFMRPGPRTKESWVYGDNFVFWGMIETASHLGDAPNEISLYSVESYWEGYGTKFRRNTLRLDGFVSAQATAMGGELATKPVVFAGDTLSVNLETSCVGELKVELQNPDGTPIPGFALDDCYPIFGDYIEFPVSWRGKGTDVSALAGKPVRIRFALKEADLYAFQFLEK